MPEIRCPHCGEVFQVDESDYQKIVHQVRDEEFKKDLQRQMELSNESHSQDLKEQKLQLDESYSRQLRDKDAEINRLKGQLENQENTIRGENQDALREKEKEIDSLKNSLENQRIENERQVGALQNQLGEEKNRTKAAEQNTESQLKEQKLNLEIAHREEISNLKDEHKQDLENKLQEVKDEKDLTISGLEDELRQLKEYKNTRSVKVIGEDLEQYCATEFEKVRHIGFRKDSFRKDNDASEGSKGDFIYEAYTDDGTPIVSIMFDMKDESDLSATKHKNEDFLDKLDKDRTKKGCEYAVLVSTLEKDSDLYNQGIVDVSHIHEKMYVIRPEFFVPMITLLRNASLNSVEARKEVAVIRQENVDMANFTDTMNAFYKGFYDVYQKASKKHQEAVGYIDKMITMLQKMKDALTVSTNHLKTAKNKIIKDGTPKALTKKSPSIANQLVLEDFQIPDFDEPSGDKEKDDYGDTSFLDK